MEIICGEITAGSKYQRKTDDELFRIAYAISQGQIFGSWMIRPEDAHLRDIIFMALGMFNELQMLMLKRDGIAHFYGRTQDAIPNAVGGYPMMPEMTFLDAEDYGRLMAIRC